MNDKPKKQSVWSRLWRTPGGMKQAEAAPKPRRPKPRKDPNQSIAEFINFGGKFRDPKKDYKRQKGGY